MSESPDQVVKSSDILSLLGTMPPLVPEPPIDPALPVEDITASPVPHSLGEPKPTDTPAAPAPATPDPHNKFCRCFACESLRRGYAVT